MLRTLTIYTVRVEVDSDPRAYAVWASPAALGAEIAGFGLSSETSTEKKV